MLNKKENARKIMCDSKRLVLKSREGNVNENVIY